MFEHCSLCFRVRMMAALKHIHLQETVVLDDDTDTMVALVGKRRIPILVKNDGKPMLESMDMVKHIEGIGDPVLTGPERLEVADWAEGVAAKTAPLTWPRYPLLGLPEFATVAALDHYTVRKRTVFGDLVEVRAKTREYIKQLMPYLDTLDRLIEAPAAVNGTVDGRHPGAAAAAVGSRRAGAPVPREGALLLRNDDGKAWLPAATCGLKGERK
jgi:glutaredoxin 2